MKQHSEQSGQNSTEEWVPCPAGTLSDLAYRQRRKRFLKKVGKSAEIATILVVAIGIGWLVSNRLKTSTAPTYGGLTCQEVVEILPEFLAEQTSSTMSQRVETHLAECEHCAEFANQMRENSVGDAVDQPHPRLIKSDYGNSTYFALTASNF